METLTRSINIEIHPERCESELTWDEAVQYCKGLGEGWRLPTISEMFYLYEDKIITGGEYWSSTESGYYGAWYFYFGNGTADYYSKYNANYVRAVRDI